MKVVLLRSASTVYSGNAYLVLGSWNALDDVNTLVDSGTDGSILSRIAEVPTGLGKHPVEQVVLTHGHFDHAGGVRSVVERYGPTVNAFAKIDQCDKINLLRDGKLLKMGDRYFEVMHTPGHSQDSICLYCQEERVLFSGDVPLKIISDGGTYTAEFVESLEKIASKDIRVVYPGHGDPVTEKPMDMIRYSLKQVGKSNVVPRENA